MDKKVYNLFVGKAGHLAVMSELALRGYNPAIPEVDIGDDVYAVDEHGHLTPVQVKTYVARQNKDNSYSAYPVVKKGQLLDSKERNLQYVFAVRIGNEWEFINFSRLELADLFKKDLVGTDLEKTNLVQVNIKFTDYPVGKAMCERKGKSDFPLEDYRNQWRAWDALG
jgi:hypothetical protein